MYCLSQKFGVLHMDLLNANAFSWDAYDYCAMYINIYPRAHVHLHHV